METPIADQSPEAVFSKEEQIIAFVQSAYPTLDLSAGTVLRDLVIKLYAHLETRIQEQIDLALISSSLLEISKNPDAVDDTQLERVLSNFNVTRAQGSTASGTLRMFFSSNNSTVIPKDMQFTMAGLLFQPAASYVLVSLENYTGASNQRVFEQSGSLYTVVIDLIAVTPGSAGNIRATTVVTGVTPSVSTLTSAKADSDFTGGADEDDNVTLLSKAKTGIVGKVFGGRDHIKAKLKTQFSGIKDVGVVGFLDPEMTRDLVDGVHIGNRIDLYVKSAAYPSRVQEKLAAQMISYDVSNQEALFEIVLPSSKAAGMYSVENIKSTLSQQAGLELVSDVRTLEGNSLHLVQGPESAAFTAYQKATIRFLVPYPHIKEAATPLALGLIENGSLGNPNPWLANEYVETSSVVPSPTAPTGPCNLFLNTGEGFVDFFYFYVEYLKMPNIVEIQGYVDSAAERSLSADVLVHAPIPAMCSLEMRLIKPAGAQDPDMAALKAALVSKFNSFEMGQSIPASALIHTAYQNIPSGYTVDLPVHLYAVVIGQKLEKDIIYSSDALKPPKMPSRGLTQNTVAFFLESALVDIAVVECRR
jgi:hypothetical protein